MKILACSFAFALLNFINARGDEVVRRVTSDFVGRQIEFVLTESRLEQAPRWPQDADNPPLPPRKALKAAIDYLKVLVKAGADWRTEGIKLEPMGKGGQWIYIVEVLPPGAIDGKRIPSKLIVLMDGEVVKATLDSK